MKMPGKIVVSAAELPDPTGPEFDRFCFDVETISFDDAVPALNPWKGTRIGGLSLGIADGSTWYIPVRHRDLEERLLPLDAFRAFCAKLFDGIAHPDREGFGHNVKFDLRMLAVGDEVIPTCRIADTMVLARLVDNTTPRLNLDFLGKKYNVGGKEAEDVKAYVRSFLWVDELGKEHRGTQDYGRVPVRIMAPYAMRDVAATYALRRALEARLPDFSQDLWTCEKRFTAVLCEVECDGVLVDTRRLKLEYVESLRRMIEIVEEIREVAGWEVDPNSERDKTELLVNQLKIQPTAYTATGKPQWTKAVLHNLEIPASAGPKAKDLGRMLQSYSYLSHFVGTYIEGWLTRVDAGGRLHPDLKQAGTITGRLSASDPNTQNIPVEAERFIVPPPGHVIVAFDFSQVEYRVFAHYTEDPTIKGAYLGDPDADFHQYLADVLGVPRQFAKTLNFSFVYGMGREKLLLSLTAMMTVARAKGDTKMEEKLRDLVYVSGVEMAEKAKIYQAGADRKAAAEAEAPKRVDASEMSTEQLAALSAMVSNTGGAAIAEKGREYIEKMKREGKTDLSLAQQAGMHDLIHAGGKAMVERAAQYVRSDDGMMAIAEKIYNDYHAKFPSIRAFSSKVYEVARIRKYVRNIYGRKYDFDMSKHDTAGQRRAFGPHRALNYLIQGSCADLLRKKIVELRDATRERFGARLFMTVHDSVYFYVPREQAPAFYCTAKRILQDVPEVGVPIFVDGKVATKNVAADVEVDESGGRYATEADVVLALAAADDAPEHGFGAVQTSAGYRVGRHGV